MHANPTTITRFWSKVDTSAGPDACWPWLAARFAGKEYGVFRHEGKNLRSHRVAYELSHGPVLLGFMVLHSCDNPACCNPAHLKVGTHSDNMADRRRKGRDATCGHHQPERRARGERINTSKLTPEDVRDIRLRYVPGHRSRPGNMIELSAEYGVSPSTIQRIATGQYWKHVT